MNKTIKFKSPNRFFFFLFLNIAFTGIIFISFQDRNDQLGICDNYENVEIVYNQNTQEFFLSL